LIVIDVSNALHSAFKAVFGTQSPAVQSGHRKTGNVMGCPPERLKEQTNAAMQGAFRLGAKEGLAEMFAVNRPGLSANPALPSFDQ
jgi:hypothetical protein